MGLLYSKHFAQFLENLSDNIFSLEAMIKKIDEHLPLIAQDISLGKLESRFRIPASVYEPTGLYIEQTDFIAEEGFEDQRIERNFTSPEGGSISIIIYLRTGCTWTEQEKNSSIPQLCQLLYVLCSRARLMGMMRQVEHTDGLTGALNSQGFQATVAPILAAKRGAAYTAVFCNIKNFKYINQQVGGNNGNVILRQYSFKVISFLGENGFFCRLGGDNFLTLVKNELLDEYLTLIQTLSLPITAKGEIMNLHLTFKVGVYQLTESSTINDIMTNTGVAVVAAKQSRSMDIIYFTQEMLERSMHDKGISSSFPSSLAKKEFLVYYQPKVDLRTNTLCGCEALTRWMRDRIISPAEFIPVLENEGSIQHLDFYMLEGVCRDLRDWLDRGIEPVRVSTNFSKIHLSNPHLEEDMMAVLKKYNVPTKYLEIELTELSDYKYYDRLIIFVNTMHGHGVHISIDDFGTGYSSLKLIKDLQADVIKLDKSLIDNIQTDFDKDSSDEIVSRAIINMAKELKVDVIAEGVETPYQADFLRKNGCSMAQGYLFDKPLPHDVFESRLAGTRVYTIPS